MVEITFPVEFVVHGTPVSLQASARSKQNWAEHIRAAAANSLAPDRFNTTEPIGIRVLYFTDRESSADLDNILKPIFDGLNGVIYIDDKQIEWIEAHRFAVDRDFGLPSPSDLLLSLVAQEGDRLYLKIMLSRDGGAS